MEKICEKEQRSWSIEAGTERYNGLSGMLGREPFSKHSQLFYIGIHKY